MITKEQLQARLAGLLAGREQMLSDLFHQQGAIKDCEYWIGEIEKSSQPPQAQLADIVKEIEQKGE